MEAKGSDVWVGIGSFIAEDSPHISDWDGPCEERLGLDLSRVLAVPVPQPHSELALILPS